MAQRMILYGKSRPSVTEVKVIQDCRSLNVKKVALLLLFFDVSSIGV
jgi:hypothetical protein